MMKSMIVENGVTFKELEKNIYSWICQIGRDFTQEFMERYDRAEYQCDGGMECDQEALCYLIST